MFPTLPGVVTRQLPKVVGPLHLDELSPIRSLFGGC
jgi:hypothetical protein